MYIIFWLIPCFIVLSTDWIFFLNIYLTITSSTWEKFAMLRHNIKRYISIPFYILASTKHFSCILTEERVKFKVCILRHNTYFFLNPFHLLFYWNFSLIFYKENGSREMFVIELLRHKKLKWCEFLDNSDRLKMFSFIHSK